MKKNKRFCNLDGKALVGSKLVCLKYPRWWKRGGFEKYPNCFSHIDGKIYSDRLGYSKALIAGDLKNLRVFHVELDRSGNVTSVFRFIKPTYQ